MNLGGTHLIPSAGKVKRKAFRLGEPEHCPVKMFGSGQIAYPKGGVQVMIGWLLGGQSLSCWEILTVGLCKADANINIFSERQAKPVS
jgi:hypothetical protein